jgi:hypothetical protein
MSLFSELLFLVCRGCGDTSGLLSKHQMMDHYECAETGGMLGRENRSTRRKPAPVPLSTTNST